MGLLKVSKKDGLHKLLRWFVTGFENASKDRSRTGDGMANSVHTVKVDIGRRRPFDSEKLKALRIRA